MHIDCPECKSKFLIDPQNLGEEGRKVRCGECSHIWFQPSPSEEEQKEIAEVKEEQQGNIAEAMKAEAAGEKPQLPTVIESKKAPKYLKVAAIALFFLNLVAFVIFNRDVIGHTAFYDMIRQYQAEKVVIGSISMEEPLEKEDIIYYYLNFDITNNSNETRKVPHKRVSLYNPKMELIKSSSAIPSDGKLEPAESKKFERRRIEDETRRAKYLVLDIGNPSDLAAR